MIGLDRNPQIYDFYVRDGLKMHEIDPRLDAQGVRPPHAQHWSCSTVAVILRNEAYIGKAAYLKTMSSGKRTRHNRTGRQKAGAVRRLTSRTARAREDSVRTSRSRPHGRSLAPLRSQRSFVQPGLIEPDVFGLLVDAEAPAAVRPAVHTPTQQ